MMIRSLRLAVLSVVLAALALAGCGSDDATVGEPAAPSASDAGPLRISAIPDQDPDKLLRQFEPVAERLAEALGVEVEFVPVVDYEGAVNGFVAGDLDLVWFGGLTGVQARQQVAGSHALAQRDIDAEFTSVFIAGTDVGLDPIDTVDQLSEVAGHTFTFGSDSSTSGRLMPQDFLDQAGVTLDDLDGQPGFSGSHDATISVVEAGAFEVGALNSQVWDDRVAAGEVDLDKVMEIFRTPPYHDYHWVVHPAVEERFGTGMNDRIRTALLDITSDTPEGAAILEQFGAGAFIAADDGDYAQIEAVARAIGKLE